MQRFDVIRLEIRAKVWFISAARLWPSAENVEEWKMFKSRSPIIASENSASRFDEVGF